jgi:hypothetical protein
VTQVAPPSATVGQVSDPPGPRPRLPLDCVPARHQLGKLDVLGGEFVRTAAKGRSGPLWCVTPERR